MSITEYIRNVDRAILSTVFDREWRGHYEYRVSQKELYKCCKALFETPCILIHLFHFRTH
jgi:hypothetical protein